jgi:hypothetical protein
MPGYGKALAWLIGGILLTFGGYLYAGHLGGYYFVFYGAIGYGLLALYRTWRARRAWTALMRSGFTSQQIASLAARQAASAAQQEDAGKIRDRPGDDFDSWKARQGQGDKRN